MIQPSKQPGVIQTPEQIAERKEKEKEALRIKTVTFKKRKEELMREMGVVEIPIVSFEPTQGLAPTTVILPYDWKPGEVMEPPTVAEIKKDAKAKKTK